MDEEELMRAISVNPIDSEALSLSRKLSKSLSRDTSVSMSTSLPKKSSNFGEDEDNNSFDRI
jgi:hypothetical protein